MTIEARQQFREMDLEDQVALYHARGRRRSHKEIMSGLFRSSTIAVGTNDTDLTTRFPSLAREITFTTKIKLQENNASEAGGFVFVLGNTGLEITSGSFALTVAGNAVATVAVPGLGDVSIVDSTYYTYDIALSISPGTGKTRLWVNGNPIIRDTNGSAYSSWASGTTVDIGSTLANADMILPLSVFNGQKPRFFG